MLVAQLFDFFIALAASPRFGSLLLESLPQLLHQVLGDFLPIQADWQEPASCSVACTYFLQNPQICLCCPLERLLQICMHGRINGRQSSFGQSSHMLDMLISIMTITWIPFLPGYIQMSSEQERRWTQDPEEFIQDEDEEFVGPRASGAALCNSDCLFWHARDTCDNGLHVQAVCSWRHCRPPSQKRWPRPFYLQQTVGSRRRLH